MWNGTIWSPALVQMKNKTANFSNLCYEMLFITLGLGLRMHKGLGLVPRAAWTLEKAELELQGHPVYTAISRPSWNTWDLVSESYAEVREIALWLKAQTSLTEDRSLIPRTMSGSSQLPMTPAPWGSSWHLWPLQASMLMCTNTHMHTKGADRDYWALQC